jgi:hypothetical protein
VPRSAGTVADCAACSFEPVEARRRQSGLVGEQRAHLAGDVALGSGSVEQLDRREPVRFAELPDRGGLDRLESVEHRLVGGEITPLDAANTRCIAMNTI